MSHQKLYRSCENRIIAGVCAGIAEYFDIDPVIVRLIFVVIILAGGAGILAYLIAWLIIPENPNCPKCCAKEAPKTIEKTEIAHPGSDKKSDAHLIIGIILAFVGVLILFNNLFGWNVWEIWKYWPILIIIAGLTMAFGENKKHWLAIALFIVLLILLFQLFFPQKIYTRSHQNDWQESMNRMHEQFN